MTRFLFVYGTLRRRCHSGAHQRFLSGANFVADAKLQAKLFRISYYPAATLTHEDLWVQGEVYELRDEAQLAALDEYEESSVPPATGQEYNREIVNVLLSTGQTLQAWTYLYNRPTDSLELITSGDFLRL